MREWKYFLSWDLRNLIWEMHFDKSMWWTQLTDPRIFFPQFWASSSTFFCFGNIMQAHVSSHINSALWNLQHVPVFQLRDSTLSAEYLQSFISLTAAISQVDMFRILLLKNPLSLPINDVNALITWGLPREPYLRFYCAIWTLHSLSAERSLCVPAI